MKSPQETRKNNISQIIALQDITIGDGYPCLVIPEGCSNHMGSLSRAKEMAQSAKEAGAKIIKWQLHLPEEEMIKKDVIKASKKMLAQWGSLWHFYEKFELSVDEHYELKNYCDKIGIIYFCTPFSIKAAGILNEMNVAGFKIGSGEADDLLMIEEIIKFKRPLLISTGMSTLKEIDMTIKTVHKSKIPLAIAHCMSIYAKHQVSQLNYQIIPFFKERYHVPVGLSDHTPPDPIQAKNGNWISHEARIWGAIHEGANFIEKHYTLDRKQDDADSCFSLNPDNLKKLIQTVDAACESLGNERKLFKEEMAIAKWAKHSLVTTIDIPTNTKIVRTMITSKRPGTGIRTKDYRKVIGKKSRVNIPKNTLLKWKHLTSKEKE